MSDPSLDRATTAIGELSKSVRSLHDEVVQSEALRARKIQVIGWALAVMVPAVVLLIIMAVTNVVLLSKVSQSANDARATNQLLYGCFQPGTQCSTENLKRTADVMNQLRQTQFVIAVCQRQNPIADDPDGAEMIACVQRYYPTFTLPRQVR